MRPADSFTAVAPSGRGRVAVKALAFGLLLAGGVLVIAAVIALAVGGPDFTHSLDEARVPAQFVAMCGGVLVAAGLAVCWRLLSKRRD